MITKRTLHTAVLAACAAMVGTAAQAQQGQGSDAHPDGAENWNTIEQYCMDCHNLEDYSGGVAFDLMSSDQVGEESEVFEEAVRRLKGGLMPPPGEPRPDNEEVTALAGWLENRLDAAAGEPRPGHIPLRRLNRREYQNAVRDLLGLNIEAEQLLPEDNLEGGYDNNAAALQVSPAFIDQYLNAARTIAHDAVGDRRPIPIMETYGNVSDMIISLPARGTDGTGTQQRHYQGMPFGTRGGMSVEHTFLADGTYELNIGDLALAREVPNLEFEHTLVALLDGEEFYRTTIGGEADHKAIDQIQDDAVAQINARLRKIPFQATAGQHTVTVTFLHRSFAESDERTPISALEGGQDRLPAVHALQVRGPLEVTGMSQSESREKIFVCYPRETAEEAACAEEIITSLAERAFRRPLTDTDMNQLMGIYEASRETLDFEWSVRDAISAILVSPHFIYRAEGSPLDSGSPMLSNFELASRLSFFIWSSIPDEELLTLAKDGQLKDPEVLRAQVSRMIADPRAKPLVEDFTHQWLHLSKLDEITPNFRLFRHASRSLDPRPMFKKELNLFLDSVLRSDQPVTRLLDAEYTFLNERLASHYGIEDVKGSRYRRVELEDAKRHGLLGKGAILMMTANPNRTSPVLRGAWLLEKVLGTPPGEPPPNVESFPENDGGGPALSVRERLEQHAANPSCFGCHGVMDPLGLALENFDTVGIYREFEPDTLSPIDATGELPGGIEISGPVDLQKALVDRKEMFVQTMTENLMTFALGRQADHRDMPLVREIVRKAKEDDYRFDSIVFHIVNSAPFRMRGGEELSSTGDASEQQASLSTQ